MATTITDIRVAADTFPLGRILQSYPDVEIELERLVPTDMGIIPLFWVTAENEAAVTETLRNDPLVDKVEMLMRTGGRLLLSVAWNPDTDELIRIFTDLGVTVLRAVGTAEFWEFRLQFTDREQLRRFRHRCREKSIPIELLRVYNPALSSGPALLTDDQREALETAYEYGYWDVPRVVTQAELATIVGISDNSMSQRLRRGVRVAVGQLLYGTSEPRRLE